jgi:hypothetical protein
MPQVKPHAQHEVIDAIYFTQVADLLVGRILRHNRVSSSLDMHEMGCSLVFFLFLSMGGFVVVSVREP